MECPENFDKLRSASVFGLLTRLCEKTVEDYRKDVKECNKSKKKLTRKLRSRAYEVLLRKSELSLSSQPCEPKIELLTDYFVKNSNKKNIVDYNNVVSIKNKINWLFERDKHKTEPYFNEILSLVVSLRNSVQIDHRKFILENPFSFGKIDEILPSTTRESVSDPKPYQYFPPHIFDLPYSVSATQETTHGNDSSVYNCNMDIFSRPPGTCLSHLGKLNTVSDSADSYGSSRAFFLPSSVPGGSSSPSSMSSLLLVGSGSLTDHLPLIPRLMEPRDLALPVVYQPHVTRKYSELRSEGSSYPTMQELFKSDQSLRCEESQTQDIWELASVEPKLLPDLWEEASKLSPVDSRGMISSSVTQMVHWKRVHRNRLSSMNIITETELLQHLKYLTIGVVSSSFTYNRALEKFTTRSGLCLEGLLPATLDTYVTAPLCMGTCYWKLNQLVSPASSQDDNIVSEGFVYKSMCDSIRHYLVWYRLQVDKIFGEEGGRGAGERRLPSLLEVLHQLRPLARQIQTMARVYRVYEHEPEDSGMRGAGLMAYLYSEITTITDSNISCILYATLKAACTIYFRFIQKFIFEGELDDQFNEFFIMKSPVHNESFTKRYWDKGFIIRHNEVVPHFLRGMDKHILLCGKSLRLLKLCNPDDPLCVLLSTSYPPIKVCLTFPELEEQLGACELHRTQCLYVCGEPVTFSSMLVRQEAEGKATRERAHLQQAHTMDKLIEERRRLCRALALSKQQQLAELRRDAEEAAARRGRLRQRDLQEQRLLNQLHLQQDHTHALLMDQQKKKVVAYYNEIGQEVERRQVRAEWKIKRLQLDERRVQLLTSETISLNREKLELQHKAAVGEEESRSCGGADNRTAASEDAMMTSADQISNPETPEENKETKKELKKVIVVTKNNDFVTSISNVKSDKQLKYKASSGEGNVTTRSLPHDDLDMVNKNSILNTKTYHSLDTDFSPSDVLNSNVTQTKKLASISDNSIYDTYQAQKLQALRNKQKVLVDDFAMIENPGKTDAMLTMPDDNSNCQMLFPEEDNSWGQAKKNKNRDLLSQNFEPAPAADLNRNDVPQFDTEASREALRNKQKVLGHEFGIDLQARSDQMKQRDALKLDLRGCTKGWTKNRPVEETRSGFMSVDSTPDHNLNTPSEFHVRLDIETPTTLDTGVIGFPSAGTLSPTSAQTPANNGRAIFSDSGFQYPSVIEDEEKSDEEPTPEESNQTEVDGLTNTFRVKSSIWSFLDDELNFDNFKPFGIKPVSDAAIKNFEVFNDSFTLDREESFYSDIKEIIKRAQDKPLAGTFEAICSMEQKDDLLQSVENVDFSTMAACLQRSVMIPLCYQMEMVNNATLKYFLVNCELHEHLKCLRDYFFLMDGEFAKTICSNLFEKLNSTESPGELLNFATLHSILDKSFGSSIGGSNRFADKLSFIITEMPLSFQQSSPDVLECLTLTYSVSWPLNIILSQEALQRYARVFHFLVKLRRISWALENDAQVLKLALKEEFMESRDLLRSPQYHSVQLYRHCMYCVVRALHSYVHACCLRACWAQLEEQLAQARTVDDLNAAHVAYVKQVLFRCLLNKRSAPVMKLLNDIFTVVLRFHHTLNARCWHIAVNEVHYTHPLFPQLRELFSVFERLSLHLHKTAARLAQCGYQPLLQQLLALSNANHHYGTHAD